MVARRATASGFVAPEKGIGGGRGMNSAGGGVGFFGPVSLGFGCAVVVVAVALPDFAVSSRSAICKAFATSVASSCHSHGQFFVWRSLFAQGTLTFSKLGRRTGESRCESGISVRSF